MSHCSPLQAFSISLPPSHTLCLSRLCSLIHTCNWQAAVMEVNSAAAILTPSTPTFGQLELLAASDDGAIKRDIRGLPLWQIESCLLCLGVACPQAPPTAATCLTAMVKIQRAPGAGIYFQWLEEKYLQILFLISIYFAAETYEGPHIGKNN